MRDFIESEISLSRTWCFGAKPAPLIRFSSCRYAEMQHAYLQLLNRIKGAGFAPKHHVLDNEISDSMKSLIKSNCQLELVPTHCHCSNAAEVAIKAFKQQFLSILAGVARYFPKSQLEILLLQA